MSQPLIYLASPYTHKDLAVRVDRFNKASEAAVALVRQGKHVFSPIMHWHSAAFAYGLPPDADFWKEYNLNILRRCDQLLVLRLDGWQTSVGVLAELACAVEQGLEIKYIDP